MTYDFIELDRNGTIPLYQQLYDKISSAVENGSLTIGAKLPSIRKLSEDLQLSRTTIESAYQQLCIEGYIKSLPQRGYYVQSAPQKNTIKNTNSILPVNRESKENILYDLGSDLADRNETDIKLWRSHIKDVLKKKNVIASYGDPQGELALRNALALYSHGIRGAVTDGSRISDWFRYAITFIHNLRTYLRNKTTHSSYGGRWFSARRKSFCRLWIFHS